MSNKACCDKYLELMDITAEIAKRAAPIRKTKVAKTVEDAKAHGVQLGDSYTEFTPMKFIVQDM